MGAALPPIALGGDIARVRPHVGDHVTCAVLLTGDIRCWGHNDRGQLGLGDVENRGDDPGEVGPALPGLDVGQ